MTIFAPGHLLKAVLRGLLLGVVGCVLLASCLSPTEVKLELSTDACKKHPTTTIAVGAPGQAETATPQTTTTDCDESSGSIGSIVVTPGASDGETFEIQVVVSVGVDASICKGGKSIRNDDGTGCIVARREVTFVPHSPLTLPIALDSACIGYTCKSGQTCVVKNGEQTCEDAKQGSSGATGSGGAGGAGGSGMGGGTGTAECVPNRECSVCTCSHFSPDLPDYQTCLLGPPTVENLCKAATGTASCCKSNTDCRPDPTLHLNTVCVPPLPGDCTYPIAAKYTCQPVPVSCPGGQVLVKAGYYGLFNDTCIKKDCDHCAIDEACVVVRKSCCDDGTEIGLHCVKKSEPCCGDLGCDGLTQKCLLGGNDSLSCSVCTGTMASQ